jgi:hypothetical protein
MATKMIVYDNVEPDDTVETTGGANPLEPRPHYATDADRRARENFDCLSREEVIEAIHLMASQGMTTCTIARATRLSVEQVRIALAEARS